MGWMQFATAAVTLILKIFDVWKERNNEKRKEKKAAFDSGVKAILDRDASGLNSSIERLNRI